MYLVHHFLTHNGCQAFKIFLQLLVVQKAISMSHYSPLNDRLTMNAEDYVLFSKSTTNPFPLESSLFASSLMFVFSGMSVQNSLATLSPLETSPSFLCEMRAIWCHMTNQNGHLTWSTDSPPKNHISSIRWQWMQKVMKTISKKQQIKEIKHFSDL